MKTEIAMEIDREILSYVREMQRLGPVTAEPIERFLKITRRRSALTGADIADRIAYLADRNLLKKSSEWANGSELTIYGITADGMDVLDGTLPPPQWRPS